MKHPSVEAVDQVIANFELVLPRARKMEKLDLVWRYERHQHRSLDMGNGSVDESCGTPMCHAGWYALATIPDHPTGYMQGAEQLAIDLGFEENENYMAQELLRIWAKDNPNIWGNDSGSEMFNSSFAFGDDCTYAYKLEQIVDHWRGVRTRLSNYYKSLENASSD